MEVLEPPSSNLNNSEPTPAQPQAQDPLKQRICKSNASMMGKLGVQARIAAKQERERVKLMQQMLEAKLKLEPDGYVQERILRTRGQIALLDEQLLASADPRAIKAISDAIKNLSEVERVLSGRPLPGSRRPGRETTSKAPSTFEPSE